MAVFFILINTLNYVGPGITGGAFAAIVGILTAFFFSLIAIFWYPFKKLIRFIKSRLKKP
jgi:hypothetical protein